MEGRSSVLAHGEATGMGRVVSCPDFCPSRPIRHYDPDIGVELEPSEMEEFLRERSLGVMGLASGDVAYTFPIAFAYDPDQNRCLFRFIMSESSKKRQFVGETEGASLTVYEWKTSDQWTTVVLEGRIHLVAEADLSNAATLFSEVGAKAALDVFNEPLSAYDTEWYELVVDPMVGRGRFVGSRESLV